MSNTKVMWLWKWCDYDVDDCNNSCDKKNWPQNGIPCGDQVPLDPHTLRAGPKSSNPLEKDDDWSDIIIMVTAHLSQLYSAIVPSLALSSEGLNVTVLWAGAPGNPHPDTEPAKQGVYKTLTQVVIWLTCFLASLLAWSLVIGHVGCKSCKTVARPGAADRAG